MIKPPNNKNLAGQNLETERAKIMGVVPSPNGVPNASGGDTQDLTQAPIKPGEQRTIRIDFSHVPQGWNLQPPTLKIVTVTAAGEGK